VKTGRGIKYIEDHLKKARTSEGVKLLGGRGSIRVSQTGKTTGQPRDHSKPHQAQEIPGVVTKGGAAHDWPAWEKIRIKSFVKLRILGGGLRMGWERKKMGDPSIYPEKKRG